MKQLIIAAAILSAASMSAFAQNGQGGNCNGNCNGNGYHGAPGPVVGAGLPAVAAGLGFGAYWLLKRRRRKTKEV
jgi:hypothetical protein